MALPEPRVRCRGSDMSSPQTRAGSWGLFYGLGCFPHARAGYTPFVNTIQRERLSACIITYNEADRIEACVKSLSFCDDIVVVDSHSTDATREIAASLGVRVIERD